tara:strand:- start:2271 stop:3119 length:849 start_codon:yes stop_codon:yes gene_type:complete
MKNFWYSYQNMLYSALQKSYLIFFRRIFGIFYKFVIRFIRHNFSSKIIDLDNFKDQNYFSLDLDTLFIKFNCDKGSFCEFNNKKVNTHKYSIFYEKYFSHLKKNKLNILELGSHQGKGIAGFYFYFPNSKIIGANINPFEMKFKSKRIDELYVDVSSEKILKNFANHIEENLDIIIDDASHNLRDILIAFSVLFKKLKKGGTYVIEDLDQFHVFNELNPYSNELTPKEILTCIKNNKNFKSSFIDDEEKKYLFENIEDIKLEKGLMIIENSNVSDVAFIKKI